MSKSTHSIIDAVYSHVGLDAQLSDMSQLMTLVSAQEITMRSYTAVSDILHANTLKEFAESTTSSQTNAMQSLLDQLHILVTGSPELSEVGRRSVLAQLAIYLKVRRVAIVLLVG